MRCATVQQPSVQLSVHPSLQQQLVQNKDYVAHLGLGYSTGTIKTAVAPASGRTEGRASSAFFTGPALSGDTERTRQGIEAAFAWKGIKLQGE